MSHYTTGEIAKLCGVTVRTVQYYDTRGLLVPSELSEGGRRLYSEEDVRRLKVICFLRELGISISTIDQLLKEDDPGSVIELLLMQQEDLLKEEVAQRQEQLSRLGDLRNGLKLIGDFSLESIGDLAHTMENKKKLHRLYITFLLMALPFELLEIAGIVLWVKAGAWWLFALWAVLVIPAISFFVHFYHKKVAYICPQCHTVFRPNMKEFFFANHTLRTRKLTCTHCGHKGFCVETWGGDLD